MENARGTFDYVELLNYIIFLVLLYMGLWKYTFQYFGDIEFRTVKLHYMKLHNYFGYTELRIMKFRSILAMILIMSVLTFVLHCI